MSGFTLIEILIVIGISAIIFAAIFSLSTTSFSDSLQSSYEQVIESLYATRDEAVQNPGEIFIVDLRGLVTDSVEIVFDAPPTFSFGEIVDESNIQLIYAGRIKEIHVSDLGVIDH